jgi:hypothetical protein
MVFESPSPYEASRIRAAAVYCSDGRLGAHFDEFLQRGLGLPRYDRLALPGGPACLVEHPQLQLERGPILDELRFLAEAHGLTRVVLIAHEACAFYSGRLGLSPTGMEFVQRADLSRAVLLVNRVTGIESIDAYYATHGSGRVRFEQIKI